MIHRRTRGEWAVVETDDAMHIVPDDEDHDISSPAACGCGIRLELEDPVDGIVYRYPLVRHASYDGREIEEQIVEILGGASHGRL